MLAGRLAKMNTHFGAVTAGLIMVKRDITVLIYDFSTQAAEKFPNIPDKSLWLFDSRKMPATRELRPALDVVTALCTGALWPRQILEQGNSGRDAHEVLGRAEEARNPGFAVQADC